jgi:ribose transport system ATP-binding protein
MSSPSDTVANDGSERATATDSGGLLLDLRELAHAFGETRALRSASLAVAPGSAHALAGENGSGKTTLIKVISGILRPAAGEMSWEGQPMRFSRPKDALRAGVATVFQETLVAPEQSVRDNVFMGADRLFKRERTDAAEYEQAREILARLGMGAMDLDAPLWALSLAERQLVTIARSVVRPWRLLILDEATSALDARQRDCLFDYVRAECARGKSVLFTSHRMDEVEGLADSVTVLRLGSTVAQFRMAGTSPREILAAMAGADPEAPALEILAAMAGSDLEAPADSAAGAGSPAPPQLGGRQVLWTTGLRLRPEAEPISIGVAPGEILGLAGLEGQGQEDFARAISGLGGHCGGGITVLDASGTEHALRRRRDAKRHGVAYVPRDRKQEGLFFPLSILDNFGMAAYGDMNRLGILRGREIRSRFRDESARLHLSEQRSSNLVGSLSGGNQQKVLLGRWLAMDPRVMVLNDPLRGVDANTKTDLYAVFQALVTAGMAIVLVSTEIAELVTLCDRVAVFHAGQVQATMSAGDATEAGIIAAMFGKREDAHERG